MTIHKSDTAPDFTLPDQNCEMHTLSKYIGQWVLLYFYPKDSTPGCTTEACGIRDAFEEFKRAGITVFGVSVDSTQSHKKFAEKYDLPFALLADESREVVKLYDVWQPKKFMGKEYLGVMRVSFLISPEGKVTQVFDKVDVKSHANEVLETVRNS